MERRDGAMSCCDRPRQQLSELFPRDQADILHAALMASSSWEGTQRDAILVARQFPSHVSPKGGRQIDGVVEYDFAGILMMLIIAIYLVQTNGRGMGRTLIMLAAVARSVAVFCYLSTANTS